MSLTVAVCVPVRDEIDRLPRLLEGINALEIPVRIKPVLCFALDGSEDGSRDWINDIVIVKRWQVETLELDRLDIPNAGRARKAAMDLGRSFMDDNGILISTDADSRPVSNWLDAITHNICEVDLLAGRTRRLSNTRFSAARARLESYLDLLHNVRRSIDPIKYDDAPSHPHVSGANLAVTADVYDKLGGISELENGEDADFVMRARLAGFRVKHDPEMTVYTSSRQNGRATKGLAYDLKQSEQIQSHVVEHPDDAVAHYQTQALARQYYDSREPRSLNLLSELACRTKLDILKQADGQPSADAFVMTLFPKAQNARTIDLEDAARLLTAFHSNLRAKAS